MSGNVQPQQFSWKDCRQPTAGATAAADTRSDKIEGGIGNVHGRADCCRVTSGRHLTQENVIAVCCRSHQMPRGARTGSPTRGNDWMRAVCLALFARLSLSLSPHTYTLPKHNTPTVQLQSVSSFVWFLSRKLLLHVHESSTPARSRSGATERMFLCDKEEKWLTL